MTPSTLGGRPRDYVGSRVNRKPNGSVRSASNGVSCRIFEGEKGHAKTNDYPELALPKTE